LKSNADFELLIFPEKYFQVQAFDHSLEESDLPFEPCYF